MPEQVLGPILARPYAVTATTPPSWRRPYTRLLGLGDLAVLLVALAIVRAARFGLASDARPHAPFSPSYDVLGVVMAIAWWLTLNTFRTRSPRVIGHGTEEYLRVIRATWAAFALMAALAVAFKVDTSRLYLAAAFPLGLMSLLVWRKAARMQLHRHRAAGRALSNVLVIGDRESACRIAASLAGIPQSGYRVTGAWVPDDEGIDEPVTERGIAVLDRNHTLQEMLWLTGANAVMVTDTEHLGPDGLRELAWGLEGTGIELMLSPNVVNVDGSRLHLHEISGLPILHLDEPQYAGASRLAKTLFDRVGASLLILALSPVLMACAALVKLTSEGPAFFVQDRIGRDGRPFRMIKFRSMRVGADAELAALVATEGKSLAELPKLVDDPRVTAAGRVMRRYSLDELPQLFNVLKGDMSLVGPRPQRHFEVERYDHVATRRLTVRPGMTGLWQVSGRSNLDFTQAIRLDVHYVENWSLTGDLIILWRTFRAVMASDGAY
jgi:exopolysaccharide biosynthesis polyprenyl glycosylphosphotransferase